MANKRMRDQSDRRNDCQKVNDKYEKYFSRLPPHVLASEVEGETVLQLVERYHRENLRFSADRVREITQMYLKAAGEKDVLNPSQEDEDDEIPEQLNEAALLAVSNDSHLRSLHKLVEFFQTYRGDWNLSMATGVWDLAQFKFPLKQVKQQIFLAEMQKHMGPIGLCHTFAKQFSVVVKPVDQLLVILHADLEAKDKSLAEKWNALKQFAHGSVPFDVFQKLVDVKDGYKNYIPELVQATGSSEFGYAMFGTKLSEAAGDYYSDSCIRIASELDIVALNQITSFHIAGKIEKCIALLKKLGVTKTLESPNGDRKIALPYRNVFTSKRPCISGEMQAKLVVENAIKNRSYGYGLKQTEWEKGIYPVQENPDTSLHLNACVVEPWNRARSLCDDSIKDKEIATAAALSKEILACKPTWAPYDAQFEFMAYVARDIGGEVGSNHFLTQLKAYVFKRQN